MVRNAKAKKEVVTAEEVTVVQKSDNTVAQVAEESTNKKKVVEDIKLSDSQQKVYDEQKTVSAQIRWLNAEGFGRSAIAKYLGKRYQHVRNVLETPLKRQA